MYKSLDRLLLQVEHEALTPYIDKIFGYHLLQLGEDRYLDYTDMSPIKHKIHLSDHKGADIQSKYEELPFLPNSLDLVLIPHVLEFSDAPQKILNEIYHILIPNGYAIILSFNPYSLWGIWPHRGKYISVGRMRHWLNKVGFNIVEYKSFLFRPPCKARQGLHNTRFMEALGQILWPYHGGIYMIIAKKSFMAVTPLKEGRVKQQVSVTASYEKN